MRASQRFLRYVTIQTQSKEGAGQTPSTASQRDLAELLVGELAAMGVQAEMDAHGYVYGALPATPGCEKAPALGLVAHMDTSPAFSGTDVRPILHENYDGGDIRLPQNDCVIRTAAFGALAGMRGKTVITADGSTLLGADDKAGIAEIMTVCEALLQSGAPHGPLKIAFTPDEEIGEGADHFDVARFGAQFAYTLDGDAVGGIEYENFNAASAQIEITGVSVHPGSAKNVMENALLIACEYAAALPQDETPAHTEGYEGFFHLDGIQGDAAAATMTYLVRDHDDEKFALRKALLQSVARRIQAAHPTAQVAVRVRDSYYNMARQIAPCMHLIENAALAARQANVEPHVSAIRGGTDGARLSYMGVPCPNLGTGGCNYHGPYECIAAEDMDTAVQWVLNLVAIYATWEN